MPCPHFRTSTLSQQRTVVPWLAGTRLAVRNERLCLGEVGTLLFKTGRAPEKLTNNCRDVQTVSRLFCKRVTYSATWPTSHINESAEFSKRSFVRLVVQVRVYSVLTRCNWIKMCQGFGAQTFRGRSWIGRGEPGKSQQFYRPTRAYENGVYREEDWPQEL
jgi:hypothetical protein